MDVCEYETRTSNGEEGKQPSVVHDGETDPSFMAEERLSHWPWMGACLSLATVPGIIACLNTQVLVVGTSASTYLLL